MTVPPVYPPAPDGACLIPLDKGRFALVAAADYTRVSAHRWFFDGFYAARSGPRNALGHPRKIYLHRFLMEPPVGFEVDHINGDRLDCRRANMRLATRSENGRNCGLRSDNASGYKGVSWNKRTRRWIAYIVVAGKQRYLGVFATVEEAALAYNAAASALFGPFARLNEVGHSLSVAYNPVDDPGQLWVGGAEEDG